VAVQDSQRLLQLAHVIQVHLGISSGQRQEVLVAAAEVCTADRWLAGRTDGGNMGVEAAAAPEARCAVVTGCYGKVAAKLGVADRPDTAPCVGVHFVQVVARCKVHLLARQQQSTLLREDKQ
jgi:hypothetical protein